VLEGHLLEGHRLEGHRLEGHRLEGHRLEGPPITKPGRLVTLLPGLELHKYMLKRLYFAYFTPSP